MTEDAPRPETLADLYAIAYQIEADAVELYRLLADQMESHNRPELVTLFRDLERAEGIHRDDIARRAADPGIEARAREVARWRTTQSPEGADLAAVHYQMSAHEALTLALAGEERALQFFERLKSEGADPEIRRFAAELAEEEAEHVALCHRLLQRYPAPDDATDRYDPDPPVQQE
ncbi:MAG: ferritin family protein [Steroidobacteraceae bacterium]